MKKLLIGLGLAAAALTASAQVSVNLGGRLAPGIYGSVNIGDYGRPALVYAQPQVIIRDRTYIEDPIYLYIPVYQQQSWRRYCRQYDACNRPVYFVQERWVRDRFAHEQELRSYKERREWRDDQWHDRDERHDDDRHDNGRHDRGEGHDRGHDKR
jgi:hypothetical protein